MAHALILALLVAAAQEAPKKKLLTRDTFMNMESVGSPAISPDGRAVLFTRTWTDTMKDEHRSNLWIADTDGSRVRELTSS